MLYTLILRSPKFGGRLVSFDAAGAADVPGFVDARALRNGAGVAVYSETAFAAIQARAAIAAEWDFSAAETRDEDALRAHHLALLDETPHYAVRPDTDFTATAKALDSAETLVEATFLFPHLAHAPMEPLACLIQPDGEGVTLIDGAQFPGITQPTVAATLNLPLDRVKIETVYAGGSFGRRATPNSDYQVEAALAFDALGRTRPVKLFWTREDDIRGGNYRPMAAHRARIGLDAAGRITGWDHRIAVKSILKGSPFEAVLVHDGVDDVSVEGIKDAHYAIPGFSVGLSDAETGVPVLWWRAVGHTHTAYAMEVLIDMVAEAAGADPVAFRRALLPGETPDQRRLRGVLDAVATAAEWESGAPEGRFRGLALHKSFNTYVAVIAEVSAEGGAVKAEQVWVAVDCGIAVNPDIIRAQMEGGVGFGLGAVMRNRVTLKAGEPVQSNFTDYEPLRIADMPAVDVTIVPSAEAPTGVGEPGVPPAGPALANAIYRATGKRVTRLPMTEAGVIFA